MGLKYRLSYCSRENDSLRLDIHVRGYNGSVIDIEGNENVFSLKYNNEKNNKSGYFRTSEADINIYESDLFSIDELKTSDETEIKVEYYINNSLFWTGFVLPDFFQTEINSTRVVSMVAVDRIATLKEKSLEKSNTSTSFIGLVSRCLSQTGLDLNINTVCDFMARNKPSSYNIFTAEQLNRQRLYDDKGRLISSYDVLKSILVELNCVLAQYEGEWWIVNKWQLESGGGRLFKYNSSGSVISQGVFEPETIYFDEIYLGGFRKIEPVASEVGIFAEYGGSPKYPSNFDFHDWRGAPNDPIRFEGWTSHNGFVQDMEDRVISSYNSDGQASYGSQESEQVLHSNNAGFFPTPLSPSNINTAPYVQSEWIDVISNSAESVIINATVNAILKNNSSIIIALIVDTGLSGDDRYYAYSERTGGFYKVGGNINALTYYSPLFWLSSSNNQVDENEVMSGSASISEPFKRADVDDSLDLSSMKVCLRIYGNVMTKPSLKTTGIDSFISSASVSFESAYEQPKGTLFKIEQGDNFTQKQDIDTSIFSEYITSGVNGYFYPYMPDDTSIIKSSKEWSAPDDSEYHPLSLHSVRQRGRIFSSARDLLSINIESNKINPLAVYRLDCDERSFVFVDGSIDFLRSSLKMSIEEVKVSNIIKKEYVYSYFGGEEVDGIKGIGGISSGSSTGGGGGSLQDLQSVTEVGNETTLSIKTRGTTNTHFLALPMQAPQQEDIVSGQAYAWAGSGVSAENPANNLVSLDDVSITNPLDGQAVVWDASIGKFVAGSSGTSSTLDDVAKNGNITSVKLVGSTVFTLSNDGDYVQREHLHSSGWSLQLDGTKVHLRDFDGFSISEIDISGLLTGDLSVTVDDTDPNNPELVFKQDGVEVGRVPASALLAGVVRSGVMQDGVLIFRDNTNATVFSIDINSIASNSTITLNANGSLSGGGAFTLNQDSNKTIGFDLSSSTKSDIAKGVTAHGWGDFREFGLGRPSLQVPSDLNDISTTRFHYTSTITENRPFDYATVLALMAGTTFGTQLAIDIRDNGGMAFRGKTTAGNWSGWKEVFHSGNLRSNSENDSRYVQQTRVISAGDGLTGGGNLTANRTFSVDGTVVRTSGNQTIAGSKNFTGELRIPTTAGVNNNSIWLSGGVTAEQPTDFVLPIASASVLGGIKVGANLQISNDGVLSATGSGDGSVTSVGLSAPTGFSVSGSPVTSSGVLALSFASGYSLPTTAKQGQWDTAYSQRHTHANKGVLDGITSGKVSEWDEAYSRSSDITIGVNPSPSGGINYSGDVHELKNAVVWATGDNKPTQENLAVMSLNPFSNMSYGFQFGMRRNGRLYVQGISDNVFSGWYEVFSELNHRTNSQNDSRYLQQTNFTWNNLGGKPSTLSGYGITDAVPNSRQVIAGDGLTGGGNLTANRTIALSSSTKADIAKGVTAHGWGEPTLQNVLDKGDTAVHQNITLKSVNTLSAEFMHEHDFSDNAGGFNRVSFSSSAKSGSQEHIVRLGLFGFISYRYHYFGSGANDSDINFRFYPDKAPTVGDESNVIWHAGNLRSNSQNDGRYVRLTTDQVIKGIKEFEDQLVIPTSAPANPINGSIWLGDGITAENI